MPNGEVGDYAIFVRRQRDGRDWFLGSIPDETARTLTVTLNFLDPGRSYTTEIYRDGTGADCRTNTRYRFATDRRCPRDTVADRPQPRTKMVEARSTLDVPRLRSLS